MKNECNQFDELRKELEFEELDERLEMVQLLAVAAEEKRCNGRCDDDAAEAT